MTKISSDIFYLQPTRVWGIAKTSIFDNKAMLNSIFIGLLVEGWDKACIYAWDNPISRNNRSVTYVSGS